MNDTVVIPLDEYERSRSRKPRFRRINTNDLMAKEFEPIKWIVPGYVPEGFSVLAGRQKLGKTWLAIDIALTAGLLQAVESALAEVYDNAPLGSMIVPFPENSETDMETLGRGFRRRRGRVLMRESVSVVAAGGPAPNTDWKPSDVTPNIQPAMPLEAWQAARGSILSSFGVLPALLSDAAQGPLVREAQRHLYGFVLQPIAMLVGEEAGRKLGSEVMVDLMRPAQAYDSGNRARSAGAIISALVEAKNAGLDPAQVDMALSLVNWGRNDGSA